MHPHTFSDTHGTPGSAWTIYQERVFVPHRACDFFVSTHSTLLITDVEAQPGLFSFAPSFLGGLQCSGNEESLLDCTHRPLGENTCSSGQQAGLFCDSRLLSIHICMFTYIITVKIVLLC